MSQATRTEIAVTVTCAPFTGRSAEAHSCLVDLTTGEVLVWDFIGCHYTRVHSLSSRSQARIRGIARAKACEM